MREKRLRMAAMMFVVLIVLGVPTILFVRSQAQSSNQADGSSGRVLIEKNQIIEGGTFPAPISMWWTSAPRNEPATTLPPRFDSALQSFERAGIRDTPFSAEVQVEMVWPLREGGSTMRKATYLIYRDGQGRTRRDLTSDETTAAATTNRPRTSVINDPLASSTYLIDHRTSTVRKLALVTGNDVDSQPSVVEPKLRGTAPGFVNLSGRNSQVPKGVVSRGQVTQKEQLGQREIGGAIAEGTRLVQTISLGSSRNQKPIEITTEEWYSVELQTIVAITISDPRFGRSEYRLMNIVKGEPSKTLFVIPPAYQVKVE